MSSLRTITQHGKTGQERVYAKVILGAQTAAINSTVLVNNASPGIYRLNYLLVVTGAGSSTLTANAIYTDAAKEETIAVLSGVDVSATGTFCGDVLIENIAAANISYSVTLGGSAAVWNLYILAERLFY